MIFQHWTNFKKVKFAVLEVKKGIAKEVNYQAQIKALITNSKESENKRLVLKSGAKIDFVNVDDILYCEAEESYATIILLNTNKITSSKSLKHFDAICVNTKVFLE